MAISRANEADILVSLHRGARDDSPWSSFLHALRRQTGVESVGLIVQTRPRPTDPDNTKHLWPRASWSLDAGGANLGKALFDADRSDPLGLQRLRADRVYALSELIDPTDPVKTAAHTRLAGQFHAKYLRVMRVSAQPGTDAWVVIARAFHDVSASASALLSSLAPHISVAVLNHLDREQAARRFAIAAQANHRLGLGWVLFSAEGTVMDACDTARDLLMGAALPGPITGSRLVLQTAALTKKLGDAFVRIATEHSAEAVVLSVDPRLELLLCRQDETVVGYLRGARAPLHGTDKMLEALYGLAPSEAKFAMLLGQANDIASVASQLGLTIETGRNYSKKIYAKTGVSGQAELIFLIANSVSSLRDGQ